MESNVEIFHVEEVNDVYYWFFADNKYMPLIEKLPIDFLYNLGKHAPPEEAKRKSMAYSYYDEYIRENVIVYVVWRTPQSCYTVLL